jgi:hypothetical protein
MFGKYKILLLSILMISFLSIFISNKAMGCLYLWYPWYVHSDIYSTQEQIDASNSFFSSSHWMSNVALWGDDDSNGDDDVSVPVQLQYSISGSFSYGDAYIGSQIEELLIFAEMMSQSVNNLLVYSIHDDGGDQEGIYKKTADLILIARNTAPGQVFAHELGHRRNITGDYVSGDPGYNWNRVMNKYLSGFESYFVAFERDIYYNGQ